MLNINKMLLENSKQYGDMTTWSEVGRVLTSLGYSSNPNAGRTMTGRFREQGLLKKDAGRIVKGDSLLSITA